jgi:hypothetical protein
MAPTRPPPCTKFFTALAPPLNTLLIAPVTALLPPNKPNIAGNIFPSRQKKQTIKISSSLSQ